MSRILILAAFLSLLLTGAIFGFFYAWICSTMWGLDAADPRVAIAAMQAMNASVRNIVFAPAFFGTPFVLLATAVLARSAGQRRAAALFALAGAVYLFGGMLLTMTVNVPMNEALAQVPAPATQDEAAAIWAAYSPRWQLFNILRTVVSGVSLMLTGWAMLYLGRAPAAARG
ncbi:MAG: anthrone oxygenase family protein [Paracoccaceae bacterium]